MGYALRVVGELFRRIEPVDKPITWIGRNEVRRAREPAACSCPPRQRPEAWKPAG